MGRACKCELSRVRRLGIASKWARIAALQLLNILENKDFSEVRWGSEEHLHLFTEAKKRVFEDRAKYYADMDMAEVPVEALLSKEYAAENFNELKPYASTYDAGEISAGETIYLTVADKDGNMISLIQSITEEWDPAWFLQD